MTYARAALAISALVLLPAVSGAQRLPLPGRKPGPARPAPLPPQAEPIARALAYKRLPLSVETYPLISRIWAPGLTASDVDNTWTALGTGTRIDYRMSRLLSATLDVTTSFAGGPVNVHTIELGTRIHRQRTEHRAYPFADIRVGYAMSSRDYFSAFDGNGPSFSESFQWSDGIGAAAGVGMEYVLTRRFSLTTAGSLMRSRMTTTSIASGVPEERSFTMTAFRYTIGLRYNAVRMILPQQTDSR